MLILKHGKTEWIEFDYYCIARMKALKFEPEYEIMAALKSGKY